MTGLVSLLQILVPAAVSLLVPFVAHLTSSKRGRQARLLSETVEIAAIVEKLPDGTTRSSWLTQAERMADRYEASVLERDSKKRDFAGIGLGIGFIAAGLYLVILIRAGDLSAGWYWMALPLLVFGLFGSFYEGSGDAVKNREDKAKAKAERKLGGSKKSD